MAGVEFVSQTEFNRSPELKEQYGSYEKFITAYKAQLQSTSIMQLSQKVFNSLPQSVKDSIWATSKKADAEKKAAEEAYYVAKQAETDANYAQSLAESEFKKLQQTCDKDSLKYKEGYAKYMTALDWVKRTTNEREDAGYDMVIASKTSLRAFYNAVIAESTLNFKG